MESRIFRVILLFRVFFSRLYEKQRPLLRQRYKSSTRSVAIFGSSCLRLYIFFLFLEWSYSQHKQQKAKKKVKFPMFNVFRCFLYWGSSLYEYFVCSRWKTHVKSIPIKKPIKFETIWRVRLKSQKIHWIRTNVIVGSLRFSVSRNTDRIGSYKHVYVRVCAIAWINEKRDGNESPVVGVAIYIDQ